MYRSWSSCSTPELWWSMCCTVWSFVSMLPHLSRRATSFGPFVMEGRTAHLSKDRILHGVVDRQGAGCGGGWLESVFRWPELPRDISPEMPSGIFVCYHTFCGKLIFRGLLGSRCHQAAGVTKRQGFELRWSRSTWSGSYHGIYSGFPDFQRMLCRKRMRHVWRSLWKTCGGYSRSM